MCFPIKVKSPEAILAEGKYRGYEWTVAMNNMGHRCGYMKVTPGHPWYGLVDEWDNPAPVEVHGGVTFAEKDTPCDQEGPDDGWWIGFDCAHLGDAPDPKLPTYNYRTDSGGHVWTQKEVEAECRSMIDQAVKAEKSAGSTR